MDQSKEADSQPARWQDKEPVQTYEGGQGAKAEQLDFDAPGVKVITYASAKGLEFDTVFLPELQVHDGDLTSPDLRMRMYVMLSRARDNLYLDLFGRGASFHDSL